MASALQTYSPMVTAGYSDGAAANFLLHWGEEKREGDYAVYAYDETAEGHRGAPVTGYSPTGGDYLVEQYFYYAEGVSPDAAPRRFPLPITARLKVEPVNLTGLTANDLRLTYSLNSALINTYNTYNSLLLPQEARLTTDVVTGGATLSMDIPAWLPGDPGDLSRLQADGSTPEAPVHWPTTEADVTAGQGVGTYTFTAADAVTRAAVKARYPWLTVPAGEDFTLTAVREIVDDGGVVDASRYGVAGVVGDDGVLTLTVDRRSAAGVPEDMAQDTAFRVRLPGGDEVSAGWFADAGKLDWTRVSFGGTHGYTGTIDPGPQGTRADMREMTRRAINLGGWFQVSVQEPGVAESGFIPVYVQPRNNYYTEDKAYDFTGNNAGLYPYTEALPTVVTLPRGTYIPFDGDGNAQAPVPYGVAVTYDSATGAEPGRLHTFAVSQWNKSGPAGQIMTYGPDPFRSGFGGVVNPTAAHTAAIRLEDTDTTVATGSLRLSYEGAGGTVSTDADGTVRLAVYDTRQVGYSYRQEYTFTLTNTGQTDVRDIRVDPNGSYQVLGEGPAAYLPAGASTTFTLTYRYGLQPDVKTGKTYLETIQVLSANADPLAFRAQFRVSLGPVSKVTVVTRPDLPEGYTMGSAGLIVGETTGDDGSKTVDYTVSAPNYEQGEPVYLSAEPADEYQVKSVYYYERNDSGAEANKRIIPAYTNPSVVSGKPVYLLEEMPGYNLTVYVEFYEPISSKLRLSDITPYAEPTLADLKPDGAPEAKDIWQKAFTETELNSFTPLELLRGKGTAGVRGFASDRAQYLVVIPADSQYAQLEVKLRKLAIGPDIDPGNQDIKPRVEMYLPEGGPDGGDLILYDSSASGNGYTPLEGDTSVPTTHTGAPFPAPAQGEAAYAVIRLSASEREGETPVYRSYYVELVRDTDDEVGTLGWGNSPYGMIMADIGLSDKEGAKAAFLAAGGRFTDACRPARAAGLTNSYLTGAWAGGENYDRNDYALFVLLGEDFLDPGLTGVKDSSGRSVAAEAISRYVENLVLLDTAADSQMGRFAGPGAEDAARTLTRLDLGSLTGLTLTGWQGVPGSETGETYAIRPGIYTLVYSYLDFDGTTERAFRRPLIILGANGDVNADGTVNSARGTPDSDVDLLQGRLTDPLGYLAGGYPEAALFRYRVCDVNNDGNQNNIDANLLQHGAPAPFYDPLGYGPSA